VGCRGVFGGCWRLLPFYGVPWWRFVPLQSDNKICICTLVDTSHPINKARSLIILSSLVLGSVIKSAHSTYLFIINFIKHHPSGDFTKPINGSFFTPLLKVKLWWHVRNANKVCNQCWWEFAMNIKPYQSIVRCRDTRDGEESRGKRQTIH
jgi:hypothetical protein